MISLCTKIILGIAVVLGGAFIVAKKTGSGCQVCLHNNQNAEHSGLCTLFIKDKCNNAKKEDSCKNCHCENTKSTECKENENEKNSDNEDNIPE